MSNELRKAKLKLDFENGFQLSPDLSAKDALEALLRAIRDGDVSEVKIAAEYYDGSEKDYEEDAEDDDASEELAVALDEGYEDEEDEDEEDEE
ncbi:hypothetical protein [Sutcliffiella rhizosphaerae]|uniref:DNA primase n=1 Tax=Sutcliffiella rhizosphaerae TaxID=2880967 RepID=A0ABM8YK45_9BACI|nr:hypothetical protein [Sutcliffiella rhizosphaerae]CAG9620283.1 hypothetical protein BACCIP111883_01051 [Sutcliffiella rhizosphaerae]